MIFCLSHSQKHSHGKVSFPAGHSTEGPNGELKFSINNWQEAETTCQKYVILEEISTTTVKPPADCNQHLHVELTAANISSLSLEDAAKMLSESKSQLPETEDSKYKTVNIV